LTNSIFLALFSTLFQVGLLSSVSSSNDTNEAKTRGVNGVNLPIGLGRLLQHHPVKHRHVVVQPDGEAHEGLGQAQKLGAQPRLSGEDQNKIHYEEQKVEDVSESLENLQAEIRGARSREEKPERFNAGDEWRETENGEVDSEIGLDEDQEFLQWEIGFDFVEEERGQ